MTASGDSPPPDPTLEWQGGLPDDGAGDQGRDESAQPWYRRPGPLTALILGALAVAGLGWLIFLRDTDGEPPSTVSILRIERTDVLGDPLVRELFAEITGEAGSEDRFVWLIPPNAQAPLPAATVTNASEGGAEFQWGPTNDVPDPELWKSEIVISEEFGAEESLVANEFECAYERRGETGGRALLRVFFDDGGDLRAPRTATYRFLGYRFLAGDVTTCVISNGSSGSGASSTAGESGATPTTSTVPPVTTIPTETTTPSPTTEPGTTQPATTVSTVMSVIDSRADLSALSDLIDWAGLRATLEDPNATLTFFAPNNEALTDLGLVPDELDDSDQAMVRDILLSHLHRGDALSSAEVVALTEIDVEFGGAQPIDAEFDPPTFGFVDIIEFDLFAGNGVVHVLDDVVDPELEG
jgi:uncharacterized surface protein with fasciclin (FAS1) repeats